MIRQSIYTIVAGFVKTYLRHSFGVSTFSLSSMIRGAEESCRCLCVWPVVLNGISFCAEPYNCGNGSFLWRYCLSSTVIRGIRILPMPIWVITRFGPTCCLCLLLRPTALPTDLSLPGRGGISAWHFSCMLFTHYSCGNHRTRFYGVL